MRIPGSLSILTLFLLFIYSPTSSQVSVNNWTVSLYAGTINYQGDLKPTSFTFNHSNPAFSLIFRKPLSRWFTFRTGASIGKIEGADRYNRNYLVARNLSFYSTIKEMYAGLEINLLDITTKRFTPYMYGAIVGYHFNPYTFDNNGGKNFLNPLSTEGEGLAAYPSQKPYKLTQAALGFGVGAKYAINRFVNIGIEFSQRKTFTDYLDDVSTFYPDANILRAAKGDKAVELSWRGDELPGGLPYPEEGYQRGTKTEMDWYYFFGLTFEIKLSRLHDFMKTGKIEMDGKAYYPRCSKIIK